jgi:phosphoglycerate dehydrogenase-like enzyme
MTVGIMRTGRIGQQVMKDLSGFGCGEYGRLRRDRDLLNGAGTEL